MKVLRGKIVLENPPATPVRARLDTTSPGASNERLWQHIASEGQYNGYRGGAQAFAFTRDIFAQLIGNFRTHPSYVRGADGLGSADVIAWDFSHASELPAVAGTVPTTGAPAQGWIQDLQARLNAQGKSELWALTRWLEPARTYVKDGRYQWASVAVTFDAVNALTGKIMGAVLTSVALTNQPFIEGMNRLAASRQGQTVTAERGMNMYLESAETPERALEMIRGMLGLPETAEVAAVMVELEKVRVWSATDSAPAGVDVEEIMGGLKTILNLPTLATAEDVFTEVEKLMQTLEPTPEVIAAALPKYLPGAPNHALALERATLAMVPGARGLSRDVLYQKHVSPALAALQKQRIATAAEAGGLGTLTFSAAPLKPPEVHESKDGPILDVRKQAGRNPTERLLTHVKLAHPHLSHDQAFAHAMGLQKTHRVLA